MNDNQTNCENNVDDLSRVEKLMGVKAGEKNNRRIQRSILL